jgi:O-antigen ligase
MVTDRPLLGHGGRQGFRAAYGAYYAAWLGEQAEAPRKPMRRTPHAHNLLLILASEHGVPAVLLHLSVLGLILGQGWVARDRAPVAFARMGAIVAVWVTSGQFNNLISQGESAYAFWLALAWASCPLLMVDRTVGDGHGGD